MRLSFSRFPRIHATSNEQGLTSFSSDMLQVRGVKVFVTGHGMASVYLITNVLYPLTAGPPRLPIYGRGPVYQIPSPAP